MHPQLETINARLRTQMCQKPWSLHQQSIFTQPAFKIITSNNIPSSGKNKFALLPLNVYHIGNLEGTNYYFACFCIIDGLFRSSAPSKFPGTPSGTCSIIPGFVAIIKE